MYEIELKAHVYDRTGVVERLKTFAHFVRRVRKIDEYYHLPAPDSVNVKRDEDGTPYISVRLRTETTFLRHGRSAQVGCIVVRLRNIEYDSVKIIL